jgi:hypothetical protein
MALRVKGHALVGNGWGYHLSYAVGMAMPNKKASGKGRALCTCGAFSPVLPSQAKRVKWMREDHKPAVLAAREQR